MPKRKRIYTEEEIAKSYLSKNADFAEVKHGHWIKRDGYDGDTYYDCSVCGESWTTIEGDPWGNGMNYCPHCGTRMDAVKQDKE